MRRFVKWGSKNISLPSHTSLKLSFLPSYLSVRRLFSEITHFRFFLSDELDYSGANPGKYACSRAPRIRTGSVAVPQQERTLPISKQHLYHTISFQFFCFLWEGCENISFFSYFKLFRLKKRSLFRFHSRSIMGRQARHMI